MNLRDIGLGGGWIGFDWLRTGTGEYGDELSGCDVTDLVITIYAGKYMRVTLLIIYLAWKIYEAFTERRHMYNKGKLGKYGRIK
jgi:hypothetical protein